MIWQKTKSGECSVPRVGHRWLIQPLRRAGVHLCRQSIYNPYDVVTVAQCKTAAEAKVFAAGLEYNEDIEYAHPTQLLLDEGFQEGEDFPADVAGEIMGVLRDNGTDGHRYILGDRRWFASPDADLMIALDEHNHFPVYVFGLGRDRFVRPDSLLNYPNAQGGVPHAATFLRCYLEIMGQRVSLNGSRLAALQEPQGDEIVNRLESGFYHPTYTSPALQ